jgi:phosphatidylserine decarboxylase
MAAEPSGSTCLDRQITSIQPGGGFCMRLELAWGRLRRAYLKTFRRGYLRRMAALRRGDPAGCPHEILDPRDLKYFRNQTDCHWQPSDDPFAWRDRLPFARSGLVELLVLGGGAAIVAAVLALIYWPAAIVPAVGALFVLWFFRNPRRTSPTAAGLVVSPADGRIAAIEELEYDEFVGGPAVLIGIFLSVFNVHINRAPIASRVMGLSYRPGKFLNALRPESARENEQMAIQLEEGLPPHRRMIVRQIAGAIARRIVCWLKPGDQLARGEQFGMIKFGSRTELVLPREAGLRIEVRIGQRVKAGTTIVARYGAQAGSHDPD